MIDIASINVRLGETYTHTLMVLQKNSINKYTYHNDNGGFMSASIYSQSSSSQALPNWIKFDMTIGSLQLQPISKMVLGSYTILFRWSSKLSSSDFSSFGSNATTVIKDLVAFGYLDKGLYVTADFDKSSTLYLPSTYSNTDVSNIQQILSDHTYGFLKKLEVTPSLSIQTVKNVSIATASSYAITAQLSLKQPKALQCRFLEKSTSTITVTFNSEYTSVTLQGPTYDVNNALAGLTINLRDDHTPCDGVLTIQDSLNPVLTKNIYNVTKLFQENQPPVLESPGQFEQAITKAKLQTATFFSLPFDQNAFRKTSSGQDDLTLTLLDPERTLWLKLTGFTISGTPPSKKYHIWPQKYHITVRVANQYKYRDIPVTLTVTMSLTDWLALLAQIAGLIGLYVYFTTIMNIVTQKKYVDPQSWVLRAGEEVTPAKIFPIALIAEELNQSKLLLKQLRVSCAEKLGKKSISDKKFLNCFVNSTSNQIDVKQMRLMLLEAETALHMHDLETEHKDDDQDSRRELVKQLVLNNLVMMQLNTAKERPTRQRFNKLKNSWRDYVVKDKSYLWQFDVDESKLPREPQMRGMYADIIMAAVNGGGGNKAKTQKNVMAPDTATTPHETQSNGINQGLLKRALVAHAFAQHHVSTKALDILITTSQVVDVPILPRWLSKFLKLDLRQMQFNKGNKLGCGLRYRITTDIIEFFGVAEDDIENKTLVLQLVQRNKRLLKEISIRGVKSQEKKQLRHPKLSKQEQTETPIMLETIAFSDDRAKTATPQQRKPSREQTGGESSPLRCNTSSEASPEHRREPAIFLKVGNV